MGILISLNANGGQQFHYKHHRSISLLFLFVSSQVSVNCSGNSYFSNCEWWVLPYIRLHFGWNHIRWIATGGAAKTIRDIWEYLCFIHVEEMATRKEPWGRRHPERYVINSWTAGSRYMASITHNHSTERTKICAAYLQEGEKYLPLFLFPSAASLPTLNETSSRYRFQSPTAISIWPALGLPSVCTIQETKLLTCTALSALWIGPQRPTVHY